MAKIHLSKRFLESLIVSSVFTFGQEQRKTRSHLVHLSHKQGAFYSCIKLMLVGINTHKNSYGKPVHPLLTAGKIGIFLFILIFFNGQIQVQESGKQPHCCPHHRTSRQPETNPCLHLQLLSQPEQHWRLELALPPLSILLRTAAHHFLQAFLLLPDYHSFIRYQKKRKICQVRLCTLSTPQNAPVISNQITWELYNRQWCTDNFC